MNPWPFVIAAYGIALGAVSLLLVRSWRTMRAAERRAHALRGERR